MLILSFTLKVIWHLQSWQWNCWSWPDDI